MKFQIKRAFRVLLEEKIEIWAEPKEFNSFEDAINDVISYSLNKIEFSNIDSVKKEASFSIKNRSRYEGNLFTLEEVFEPDEEFAQKLKDSPYFNLEK